MTPAQIDETSIKPIRIPKERYLLQERQRHIIDKLL